MAFAPNSISSYWSTRGNCPPTNGKDGLPGATGPAGTNGTNGTNGASYGQNYYFQLAGNIIDSVNQGPAGTIQPIPSIVGGNTAYTGYTGPPYSGYFAQVSGTGDNIPMVKFVSTAINQTVVPAGPWTMYNNIYSFPAPVGPQPWQVPTVGTPNSEVYATVFLHDGPHQILLFRTETIDVSNLNQEVIRFDGGIQTPVLINNPTTAYFTIVYTIVHNSPGNVYELWTQGNSFSHVTTSFGVNQGGTGPAGPTGAAGTPGATGSPGTPGAPGDNGEGLQGQLAYYKNTNVIGGTSVATITPNVLTVRGNTGSVQIGEVNPGVTGLLISRDGVTAGFIGINSTNNIFLGAGSIPQPGGNVNIQNTLNVPSIGLGSLSATNPPAQINVGQEATIVIAGWRFSWGRTPSLGGSTTYNFITPFASLPVVTVNPLRPITDTGAFSVVPTFNSLIITTTNSTSFHYMAIGPA